jgi:hypothetical protein
MSINRQGKEIERACLLDFTDEICFERARRVIPFESLSIAIPKLEAIFLFAILVFEVVWFTSVPICERDWSTVSHPEEISLVGQISSRCPEVFVAETLKN